LFVGSRTEKKYNASDSAEALHVFGKDNDYFM